MTDEIIQADIADDDLETVDEVKDSPSDDAETSGTDDVTETEAETGDVDEATDDEEVEPFRHVIPYKSNGEDSEFVLEYDADGNLTPETLERTTQVLAKTGLEKVAQEKHAKWQDAESQLRVREARIKFLESQIKDTRESFSKPAQAIEKLAKKSPNLKLALQQQGIEFPNVAQMELQDERKELAAERRLIEENRFVSGIFDGLSAKGNYDRDALSKIGAELLDTPLLRRLTADPNAKLSEYLQDALDEADMVIAKLTMSGALPNPELEKARKASKSAGREVAKAKEQAKRVAAVKSPLAGGRPKGTKGRETTVDMRGWSPAEAARYAKTGKLPTR